MDICPARLWLHGVGGLRSGYDGAQHASRSRPVCANPCAGPRDLDEASALWSDRWQLAVAAVTNAAGQSVVYAIGGTSATSVQSKVMAYNTATNTGR